MHTINPLQSDIHKISLIYIRITGSTVIPGRYAPSPETRFFLPEEMGVHSYAII